MIKKNLKYKQVGIFESPVVVLIIVRIYNLGGGFDDTLNLKILIRKLLPANYQPKI